MQYLRLQNQHLSGAIECLTKTFTQDEPLTSHLGVTIQEFLPYAEALCQASLTQHLSFVAMNEQNKIVGVRLLTDYHREPELPFLGEKMECIARLLSFANQPVRISTLDKCVHSHVVAVDRDYSKQGIAKSLLQYSALNAVGKGYAYSIGEVTNLQNLNILKKTQAFEPLNTVVYEDYAENGFYPFKGIHGHAECVVFRLDLKKLILTRGPT